MFLGQGFQKLEHKQDRQTDKQTRPNALPAAFTRVKMLLEIGWVFLAFDRMRFQAAMQMLTWTVHYICV